MNIEAIATFIPPILATIATVLTLFTLQAARRQARLTRESKLREAEAKKELIESRIQSTFLAYLDSLGAARDVLLMIARLPEEQQSDKLRSAALYLVDKSSDILAEFEDLAPAQLEQSINLRLQMLDEIRDWVAQRRTVNDPGWQTVQGKLDILQSRELLNTSIFDAPNEGDEQEFLDRSDTNRKQS
ncbi:MULTISPECIES: hypothetical protein [Glycomyces]|uniref:Uncharacterized protein n=2 Tax=Glycomyces TaxID=58113 RepID=A0A9X3PNE2_9ACTN|nr:hypothetical protein [Glycomyces lechevalierae]MDA1387124.1 hypothetical protein [Glycomyces lechevalierae]MDR7336736.1 hypothetical protein [Glycomyces lechevalierae]